MLQRFKSTTITRITSVAVFGAITGLLSALAALVFVELADWLNHVLLISPTSREAYATSTVLTITTVAVPAVGGLLVGLVVAWWVPDQRPVSTPDAIRAVQTRTPGTDAKSGASATLASLLSIGCGASVGQYGPLTVMGTTIGTQLAHWLPRFATSSIGTGCGVAAAISAAFNAPIAGIIFAHEVILRHYSLRAFAPVTVASTMGYIVSNVIFARPALFRIDALQVQHVIEFAGFILIGVAGAFVAIVYMRAMTRAAQWSQRVPLPTVAKPMAAGAALGLMALWLPEVLGLGHGVLRTALIEGEFATGQLAVLLVAKLLASAVCLGFGFVGGIFMPALVMGVLFGALAGTLMGLITGDFRSAWAIYAICGMVAVTSPVIGAPLTSIIIVFELTRNYDLTIAAMISVVFSNLVSYRIYGRSFFDVTLLRDGFDLSLGRDKVTLDSRTIVPWISSDFIALTPDTAVSDAIKLLVSAQRGQAYVVDDQGIYHGSLHLEYLLQQRDTEADSARMVHEIVQRDAVVLKEDTTVWTAMDQIRDFVGISLPVVRSRDDDTLVGVIFEASIVRAYLDTIYEMRREEQDTA